MQNIDGSYKAYIITYEQGQAPAGRLKDRTDYVGGGEMTQNIEKMGGEGTAEFIFQAIKIHCGR